MLFRALKSEKNSFFALKTLEHQKECISNKKKLQLAFLNDTTTNQMVFELESLISHQNYVNGKQNCSALTLTFTQHRKAGNRNEKEFFIYRTMSQTKTTGHRILFSVDSFEHLIPNHKSNALTTTQ